MGTIGWDSGLLDDYRERAARCRLLAARFGDPALAALLRAQAAAHDAEADDLALAARHWSDGEPS